MIDRRAASEDEMIVAFLQAEVDSPRYSKFVSAVLAQEGLTRRIIDQPNLFEPTENEARKRLLAFRGYGAAPDHSPVGTSLSGFPSDAEWHRATLEVKEFETLKYGRHPFWIDLSEGTRLVSVGAGISSDVIKRTRFASKFSS